MKTTKLLGRNILSNWGGFVVHIIVTLAMTPFIINSLGTTVYGIWALINGIIGYYGLLDLGFRAGLTQYVSRYLACGSLIKVNSTLSTGVVLLSICGAFLAIVSIGLASCLELVFDLPSERVDELRIAMLIAGLGIALQFPLFPLSTVFPATERFDIANAIGVAMRLLFAGSTYVVLEAGYGLIGLCLIFTAVNLADYLIRAVVAFRLVSGLKIHLSFVDMSRAREFASFGIWNVLIHGSVRLISYSDTVVIGVFLPPAAITPFAVAGSLIGYFMRLFVPIGQVFFPRFVALDAKGDTEGIRELFLNGTKLLAVLACPAGLVTFWFAGDFLQLWIGNSVGEGIYPSAAVIYSVLVVAAVFSAIQRVTYQVFLGTRRLKVLAMVFLAEAVANLIISIALIGQFGLMGVAVGTLIPAFVVEAVVLPILVCRSFGIRLWAYFSRSYGPAVILLIALLPFLVGIDHIIGVMSWGRLAIEGGFAVLATMLLIPWIGLSSQERAKFLWIPMRRARRRVEGRSD